MTEGYGVRPNNQQISAVVQHELRPGFGVTVGYFRTWYGNKTVTDNLLVTPADFTAFCVAAPSDTRLPDGGGYQVCDPTDVNPTTFGRVDNLMIRAEEGEQTEVFNGIDIGMNARFGPRRVVDRRRVLRQRPTTTTAMCRTPRRRFCNYSMPWEGQTQIKFQGSYPLPSRVCWRRATYLGAPGLPQAATLSYSNAEIQPSLGRPLSGGADGEDHHHSRAQHTVRGSVQPDRLSLQPPLQDSGMRINPRLDIYNLTNSAAVVGSIAGYGAAWLRPTEILTARLVKFGAQIDW